MPPANTAAVSGATISSTAFNTLETDIGTEITNSVDRLGRSAMQADLPMGNNKATGMADPVAPTDAATKNYVDTTTATFFGTGDIKLTLKTLADTGWSIFADQTIGNAGSGAAENSAQLLALFTLLFNSPFTDANCPILTSGGGATTRAAQTNAATAWAALCRISLPKALGRALAIAGSGSGLTARVLGATVGEENHLLITAEMPAHTHTNSLTDPGHLHSVTGNFVIGTGGGTSGFSGGGPNNIVSVTVVSNTTGITINNASQGGGGTHNNMQPTTFLNAMVKW